MTAPGDIVDAYIRAWQEGDPPRAWSFYSDDVVMRLPGRGPLAGTHCGRDAVIATIQALLARTSDLTAEVHAIDRLVSGDRVAVLAREVVRRDDAALEFRRVLIYRVVDGHISDIDIFEANQYEVDDFFA